MPKDDAIIQEVRAARRRIAESCGYDIAERDGFGYFKVQH